MTDRCKIPEEYTGQQRRCGEEISRTEWYKSQEKLTGKFQYNWGPGAQEEESPRGKHGVDLYTTDPCDGAEISLLTTPGLVRFTIPYSA